MINLANLFRFCSTAKQTNITKYFPFPMIEGQYQVKPAHPVPSHITPPNNIYDSQSHLLGLSSPLPVRHDKEAIHRLRRAAKVASTTLGAVEKYAKQGMTGEDLDKYVHDTIINQGAYPTPIGFMGFPKSVCISMNEVIVHGVPCMRPLRSGDSLNVDVSVFIDGYHGDNNLMIEIGQVHPDIKKLNRITRQAVYEAIKICRPGQKINMIGKTIEQFARSHGFYVCDMFNGHGIGQQLHMPPVVHPFYQPRYIRTMSPGNAFTIEPILSLKPIGRVVEWKDGWTVISPNNPTAQFEHTVLITEDGCEVLTKRDDETIV